MKLLAQCPVCRMTMELSMNDADKRIRCQRCRRLFKVPDMEKMKTAMERLAGAASDVFVDEQGNVYG